MTADFAVQNSLYIIAKTATAIVMGSPEGWGDHSPHPFGEPSHHVGAKIRKKKRGEPHVHAILSPMQPPTTTHNAKQLHAYMKGGQPHAVLHDSPELKQTRAKLHAHLAPHAPEKPIPAGRPVASAGQMVLPAEGPQKGRVAPTSSRTPTIWKRPSGRNDPPALRADDAQVCSEIVKKILWSDPCGVFGPGGGMTYEEKKAWLWRFRTAKRFELLKLDELATLQTDATHPPSAFPLCRAAMATDRLCPASVEHDEARRAAEAQFCRVRRHPGRDHGGVPPAGRRGGFP